MVSYSISYVNSSGTINGPDDVLVPAVGSVSALLATTWKKFGQEGAPNGFICYIEDSEYICVLDPYESLDSYGDLTNKELYLIELSGVTEQIRKDALAAEFKHYINQHE